MSDNAPAPDPAGGVPLHDTLLAAVVQASNAAALQAQRLSDAATDLKESFRLTRRLRVTLAIGAVVLLLQVGIGIALFILAFQNHSIGASTSGVVARIDDCTTPKGKCAQRGQQQTAAAIAQIVSADVRAFIVVEECSRGSRTDIGLEKCVAARMPTSTTPAS